MVKLSTYAVFTSALAKSREESVFIMVSNSRAFGMTAVAFVVGMASTSLVMTSWHVHKLSMSSQKSVAMAQERSIARLTENREKDNTQDTSTSSTSNIDETVVQVQNQQVDVVLPRLLAVEAPKEDHAQLSENDDLEKAREDYTKTFYDLAAESGTDKVSTEAAPSGHNYQFAYDHYLPKLRHFPLRFLEIGLGCDLEYGPGRSLDVWDRYFTHAHAKIVFIGKKITSASQSGTANVREFASTQAMPVIVGSYNPLYKSTMAVTLT